MDTVGEPLREVEYLPDDVDQPLEDPVPAPEAAPSPDEEEVLIPA